MARVKAHIAWIRSLGAIRFILILTLYEYLLGRPVAIFVDLAGLSPETFGQAETSLHGSDLLSRQGFPRAFLESVIISPPLETMVFQWAPISIATRFTNRVLPQIAISTIVFVLPHMAIDITSVASVGVGGILLACTFVHWRAESTWKALWTTTLLHSLGNAIALSLGFLSMLVSP